MEVILWLGIFWTLYGIVGILGFQAVNAKYKNHDWTKNYIRCRGISWLMIGIPLLILYLLAYNKNINSLVMCLLILLCGIPSIAYTIINDRKYGHLLKEK